MFDTLLLESDRTVTWRGRTLGLPLVVGLHALAGGGLILASVWAAGEPSEPEIRLVFPSFRRPRPPLGDSGAGPRPAPARPRRAAAAADFVAPSRMPALADPIPASETEDSPAGGDGSGPTAAGVEGERDGDPFSPAGERGGEGPSDRVYLETEVRAPEIRHRVDPGYPEAARRARIEGVVVLEAVITKSGEIEDLRVLKSVHPLLDEAAVRAVRQWRYRAATLDGRAVRVALTVTLTFGLGI